jgi:16S rRNA (guanine966-N2)-methyltransferase
MSLRHDSPRKKRKEKNKWKYSSPEELEELEKEYLKEELRYLEPTIKGQVRITAGKVKNYVIDIPRNTRPATDMMKTRVFDILREDIANTKVLDLYAGSGSFGLEALSRGAKEATLVDASKQAEGVLLGNAKKTGFLTETHVIRARAEDFVEESISKEEEYEVIFFDPPYKAYNRNKLFKVEGMIDRIKYLLPGYNNKDTPLFKGVIIMKHPRRFPIDDLHVDGIRKLETIDFGKNSISFLIVDMESTGR